MGGGGEEKKIGLGRKRMKEGRYQRECGLHLKGRNQRGHSFKRKLPIKEGEGSGLGGGGKKGNGKDSNVVETRNKPKKYKKKSCLVNQKEK